MITLALLGYGRIGQRIDRLAKDEQDMNVLFAIDDFVDSKGYSTQIIKADDFEQTLEHTKPDIIIDFSHPEATLKVAPVALSNGVSMVVCTAGFTQEQRDDLRKLAGTTEAALLLAPNITYGINLLMAFAKIAAKVLPGYDISITDYHFKEKHDRPSGTARKLARELKAQGASPEVHGVRAGNIVGVHTVLFAGEQDEVEITHRSYSKDIFARSALDAAKAVQGRKGFLEMKDIIDWQDIILACNNTQ